MSRLPSVKPVRHLAWLLAMALTGCATVPVQRAPLDAAQQHEVLLGLAGFSLSGSVGVHITSTDRGFNASLGWEQKRDLAKVRLSAPIGGSMQLEYSPGHLRLINGRNDLSGAAAEDALKEELGFVPPFDALRYWILGMPEPGSPATETRDASGLLQQLEQRGWLISYDRHAAVDSAGGRVQMPGRVKVSRDDLRLTVAIRRWQLK